MADIDYTADIMKYAPNCDAKAVKGIVKHPHRAQKQRLVDGLLLQQV